MVQCTWVKRRSPFQTRKCTVDLYEFPLQQVIEVKTAFVSKKVKGGVSFSHQSKQFGFVKLKRVKFIGCRAFKSHGHID